MHDNRGSTAGSPSEGREVYIRMQSSVFQQRGAENVDVGAGAISKGTEALSPAPGSGSVGAGE